MIFDLFFLDSEYDMEYVLGIDIDEELVLEREIVRESVLGRD